LPTTRMKFVSASADADDDQDNNALETLATSEPETEISSDSEQNENEEINVSNSIGILWTNADVAIDSRQVHYSYSNAPNVHISDIMNATPRQFFERFLRLNTLRQLLYHLRINDLTWMEFMRFIGILTVMTYIQCADSSDYWSSKDVIAGISLSLGQYMSHRRFRSIVKYLTLTDISINDDPFYFIRQFHDAFNDNLSHAITPGSYLCIDESMCQWMGKIDKGPFQRKIPRKPHPIGCEFKAVADAQANLFLRLDPAEPPEFAKKKIFQIIICRRYVCDFTQTWVIFNFTIKKTSLLAKKYPPDITDILEDEYGSINSRKGKFDDVDLILCSLRDRKDIVLLSNCSTTSPKSEIKRYIKGHGNVKFMRPALFDEFNEYRSAVDILNNLRDNALSYHDVLSNKCSTNRILAFYLSVTEANSYSAYCQFVPNKKNLKHVDFRKQLVNSIFDYYSDEPVAERAKKRQRYNKKSPNLVEHHFVSLRCDPATKKLKGKRVQRRCLNCHKRATTCCSCTITRALCTNCWADHIRDTYNPVVTR
ncbi:44056_t:CDS:2, partial [Gigaspora margarita]